MEQQFPFAQFPQTVPPLVLPQVPSVVTAAVAVDSGGAVDVAGAMTGSAELVEAAEVLPSVHPS